MKRTFSERLQKVFTYSTEEAIRLGNENLCPEHLFLGMLRDESCEAVEILKSLDININDLKEKIISHIKNDNNNLTIEDTEKIIPTKTTERIQKFMYSEAIALDCEVITTGHLLLAILKVPSRFSQMLDEYNLEYEMVLTSMEMEYQKSIDNFLNSFNDDDDDDDDDDIFDNLKRGTEPEPSLNTATTIATKKNKTQTPVLDYYSTDYTKLAQDNKLDPIHGRDKEIERIIQILSRRKKNNPVLIGEPGVGKSAIIEGLALKIVQKNIPYQLHDKRILSLDMLSMVAGTKYRGQFEERIQAVIRELKNSQNIILFIDEIHTIVGAGSASGSLDAANILKPELARGEIQCIGATTLNEYRKSIEKDGALERRFQKIIVETPTEEESIKILNKIKSKYEEHHNVNYSEKAIEACVKLSIRYISDRVLPDKAIDAMDEAGSRINGASSEIPQKLLKLEQELQKAKETKCQAIKEQLFEKAASMRDLERKIEENINLTKQQIQKGNTENRKLVDVENIAETISTMTGIPVKKINQSESNKLIEMKNELGKRIIGQNEAIETVVRSIQRNRAGLKAQEKPVGSFIFLGPTGVGKTQLAKTLAKYLFDNEDALIRIDMSEYMEKFSISRLIGAPPGYVGYEEGGQLSEAVRRKPYSVVLLDEIEKAHQDVFHILLQILDEGRLTDSLGRYIDFRNAILIITSNIGSRQLSDFGQGIGFSTNTRLENRESLSKNVIENALKKTFAPEFLNRIDDIVMFNSLSKQDIYKIVDIELENLYERVKSLGYSLKMSTPVKDFIVEQGFDSKFGARPLKRAIQKNIENLLAEEIIRLQLEENDTICVGYNKKSGITVKIKKAKEDIPIPF